MNDVFHDLLYHLNAIHIHLIAIVEAFLQKAGCLGLGPPTPKRILDEFGDLVFFRFVIDHERKKQLFQISFVEQVIVFQLPTPFLVFRSDLEEDINAPGYFAISVQTSMARGKAPSTRPAISRPDMTVRRREACTRYLWARRRSLNDHDGSVWLWCLWGFQQVQSEIDGSVWDVGKQSLRDSLKVGEDEDLEDHGGCNGRCGECTGRAV